MRYHFVAVFACVCTALSTGNVAAQTTGARAVLDTAGIRGGLIVHIGCGDGRLTATLHAGDGCLVHGLDTDPVNVARARRHTDGLGLGGKVSCDRYDGKHLPYVDNLVNLLVAEDLGEVAMAEVMRVLAPRGVVFMRQGGKWAKTVKPVPAEIDEWTHYLYDSTNNAVAQDELVGPPRRVQWKAGPMFARHHDVSASVSAAVTSGGRLFYIIDEAPASLMSFPPKWRLVGGDASSGVLLWKRPIAEWANHLRPFRSGPPQLPRRLVALGERVYVTLGLQSPVSQLDAASGETLVEYQDTERADEILLCDGILVLVVFDPQAFEDAEAAGRRGVPPADSPRRLMAVDAASGEILWRKSGEETVGLKRTTLAAGGNRVVFQCADEVRCAELKTGSEVWRRPIDRQQIAWDGKSGKAPATAKTPARPKKPPKRSGFTASFYAPTLVLSPEHKVVLSADLGKLVALDFDSGEVLWSCPCTPDFHAPADVFLASGLIWSGLFAVEGRDPRSGEVRQKLDIEGLLTAGHHPRCYRNKATERFVISDKRGAEFFDLSNEQHSRHNWVRGSCQYGLMPAGGLMYVPPNACCCYAGAQLHGSYALAGAEEEGENGRGGEGEAGERLQRGTAFDKSSVHQSSFIVHPSEDWPTFRGDAVRRGATGSEVPTRPVKKWATKIGGKLTAPVVAGGTLFVAEVDLGRVRAIDAASGKTAWTFTAGGRIDSPPTIVPVGRVSNPSPHVGRISNPSKHTDGLAIRPTSLCLFGSADGYVYCLRADDGELVWQFRAAPQDRRIVVDDQLESVWPVHGNVLVHDGMAYFAAGRSCYLDGGITLFGLDPATGKKICETQVVIPNEQDESVTFVMAGVRPDVLVTDGEYIYLQQLKFDRHLQRQEGLGRHLMAHSGLTDGSWFYRTFWRLGYGDAYDFPNSYIKHGLQVPFGQLLVFDDEVVCGVQTHFSPGIVASAAVGSSKGCLLFGDANTPLEPDKKSDPGRDYPASASRPEGRVAHRWTANLPFQARAMVIAGDTLFVAGWPDAIDADDPYAGPKGRRGGVLSVFSAADGEKLAEQALEEPPVFDGLIAADGRLYLATKSGTVVCMGP